MTDYAALRETLERLGVEATPGPMGVKSLSLTGSVAVGPDDTRIIVAEFTNAADAARIITGGKALTQRANAKLFVALRNNHAQILAAFDEVERLRGEVAKLKARLDYPPTAAP